MFYTYILQCESDPTRHYTGSTDDLKRRLAEHNAGTCLEWYRKSERPDAGGKIVFLALGAFAGMRPSEIEGVVGERDGLQWEDIDFEQRHIRIRPEVAGKLAAGGVLKVGQIGRCGTPAWNIPVFFLIPSKTGLLLSSEALGIRFLDRPNHPTFTPPPAAGGAAVHNLHQKARLRAHHGAGGHDLGDPVLVDQAPPKEVRAGLVPEMPAFG